MAVYLAVMTVTSVGYGDVVPRTDVEIIAWTVIMVFGACILTFLLGSVASMLTAIGMQETEYFKLRDQLNDFTADAGIPAELCYKLRHYCRSQFESGALNDWSLVLDRLSPSLKEEISACLQKRWISGCAYFRAAPAEALAAVAGIMEAQSFVKGEALIQAGEKAATVFIVRQGLVRCDSKLLGPGKLLGEDMLYFAIHAAREDKSSTSTSDPSKVMAVEESPYARVEAYIRNSEKAPRKRSIPHIRDFDAVAAGYTVANQINFERLVRVLSKSPELGCIIRTQVVAATFQKHVMAYVRAASTVYHPDGLVLRKDSSALVCWYEAKLRISKEYDVPEKLECILTIQRNIRTYLQKARFHKVVAALAQDPHMMRVKLSHSLLRIEARLGLEGHTHVVPTMLPSPIAAKNTSVDLTSGLQVINLQAQVKSLECELVESRRLLNEALEARYKAEGLNVGYKLALDAVERMGAPVVADLAC